MLAPAAAAAALQTFAHARLPRRSEFQAVLSHRGDQKSLFLQRIFTLMDGNRDGVMCVLWMRLLVWEVAASALCCPRGAAAVRRWQCGRRCSSWTQRVTQR